MSILNIGTQAPSGQYITGPQIREMYAKACITHPTHMTALEYLERLISAM